MVRYLFLVAFLIGIFAAPAKAGEVDELYRGPRAQAMGNAFVALADDEEAVYYNPAGMAGNKKFEFHYFLANLQSSDDIYASYQQGTKITKLNSTAVNLIMGKNIYFRGTVAPTLMMPNLGISFLADGQASLYVADKAYPYVTLGYQTTNGMQLAYGITIMKPRKKRGELRIGFGAKMLWRRGGYHQLPMVDMFSLGKDTVSRMTGNFQRGIGGDLGLQYIQPLRSQMKVMGGMALTNLGDVTFGNGTPAPVRQNLTIGTAFQYDYSIGKVNLTYDYRHVLEETDWRKKNHLGVEFAFPVLSLYGGINQVYPTYGVGIDVWLVKLTAYSYTEELGSFVHQNPNHRYGLQIALKLDL